MRYLKIVTFLALSFSTSLLAEGLDTKKTINKFVDMNLSLGYNDGSTLSLSLQEARGSTGSEMFRASKEANEALTIKRPTIQKELDSLVNFIDRRVLNSACKKLLNSLGDSSRALGMVKGMHSIASNNEELISQRAAQSSLETLNSDLRYAAVNSCNDSFRALSAEVL